MSATEPTADTNGRSKLDEEDHDLLTFVEVGERLTVEVREAETLVAQLEAVGGPPLLRARTRLASLNAAAQRNSAGAINDANFEKFFGYPGKARRNVAFPQTGP